MMPMGSKTQQEHAPSVPTGYRQEVEEIRAADNLSGKFLPMLTKAAGTLTVVFAGFIGPVALLAAGAAMLGVEVFRAQKKNQADLNRELALYHKDIARVLGKAPDAKLTIQDMFDAADETKVGDKALKPLKMELAHLKERGKYNMRSGVANALISTLVTGALSLIMTGYKFDNIETVAKQGMQIFWTITGSLGISGMVSHGADTLLYKNFEANKPPTIYNDLVRLQEVAQHQNVNPEQVFALSVKIDKKLAGDIEKETGMPYNGLSHRNKLRIMEKYDSRAHAKSLAEHINEGGSVTSVALLMHGQLDPATLPQVKEEPAPAPANAPGLKREKSFRAMVTNQEKNAEAGLTLSS